MNEPMDISTCWQVGDWVLNGEQNTISRASHEITLSPRLTDVLLFMASRAGHVVSRDELVTHVWHRAIVTDQAVNQSIFELRKALRDGRARNEAPTYINTVSKRGYVLVADVKVLDEESVEKSEKKSMESVVRASEESSLNSHLWTPMLDWIDGIWRHTKSYDDKQ